MNGRAGQLALPRKLVEVLYRRSLYEGGMPVRWLTAIALILATAPAWAQRLPPAGPGDRPQLRQQQPGDTELDVANHWQALDLAHKNLAAALGRLVEDRRKLKEELEAMKSLKGLKLPDAEQPKAPDAPK